MNIKFLKARDLQWKAHLFYTRHKDTARMRLLDYFERKILLNIKIKIREDETREILNF